MHKAQGTSTDYVVMRNIYYNQVILFQLRGLAFVYIIICMFQFIKQMHYFTMYFLLKLVIMLMSNYKSYEFCNELLQIHFNLFRHDTTHVYNNTIAIYSK